MPIATDEPGLDALDEVLAALAAWQRDGAPQQLHPGDLGWQWRFGAEATAAAVRTWRRDGRVVAVGMIDSPTVVRLAVAPDARDDEELARTMSDDLVRPERGLLPAGEVAVEARFGGALVASLVARGWEEGEAWAPLRRDLAAAVADCGRRVEVVDPARSAVRAAVQRAAFDGSTFTDARWRAMAAGAAYARARCLIAYDDHDDAVAAATVWSAGTARPGLLEPLGVHREHRGRGHGTAITLAAAAALRAMGASSAVVCTPSTNVTAVATYASAGFERLPDVHDLRRGVRVPPDA